MMRFLAVPLGIALLLGACSALPSSGPSAGDIRGQAGDDLTRRYEVVDVNETVVSLLLRRPTESFYARFGDYRPPAEPKIGVGDTVAVTIWEAGPGGLFSAPLATDRFSTGSKSATIPEQVVSRDGTITVPYAGQISVVNLTPQQVREVIEEQLAGKAIQPQVLVTVTRALSSSVSVNGEVAQGARIPLSVKGDKILDIVATAGGVRAPVNETVVRLSRGKRTASVPMTVITTNPRENIYLRPGDALTLLREPQTFMAYGATGRNAEIPFDAEGITLAQALAKAGGLLDFRADPEGVFLFRFEPEEHVRRLRPESALLDRGGYIPVVYRLNMRDPNSLFLAQAIRVQKQDVLYVTNSQLTDLQKVLQTFQTVTSPVSTGVGIANGVN
jgi:polysaccharide export outer membrane protein